MAPPEPSSGGGGGGRAARRLLLCSFSIALALVGGRAARAQQQRRGGASSLCLSALLFFSQSPRRAVFGTALALVVLRLIRRLLCRPQDFFKMAWGRILGKRRIMPTSSQHALASGPEPLASLGGYGRAALFESLNSMRADGSWCDVKLRIGSQGREFSAHKCVLAAASPPLRRMFEGGFREQRQSTIALADVNEGCFAQLLDFVYGREVHLNPSDVESLLELSCRYEICELRKRCCNFMAAGAAPDSAGAVLIIADRYDCRSLRRQVMELLLHDFASAASSSSIRILPIHLLTEVISSDNLVAPELLVFHAVADWIQENAREDEVQKESLLQHVRFSLIASEGLIAHVEPHPIMQSASSKALLYEAFRWLALSAGEERNQAARGMGRRAQPRGCSNSLCSSDGQQSLADSETESESKEYAFDEHDAELERDKLQAGDGGQRRGSRSSQSKPVAAPVHGTRLAYV